MVQKNQNTEKIVRFTINKVRCYENSGSKIIMSKWKLRTGFTEEVSLENRGFCVGGKEDAGTQWMVYRWGRE